LFNTYYADAFVTSTDRSNHRRPPVPGANKKAAETGAETQI
jgi:hypothetical protein